MRFLSSLSSKNWPWYLALIAVVVPAWMALRWSLLVPHADHWYVVAVPWADHLGGASWSSLFHHQMNDSRLDAAQFVHFTLASLTGLSTRAESVMCVVLAALSAVGLVWLWRRCQPGTPALALLLAWFCTLLWLTPDQTMNWLFGVQITYMQSIACSVAVVVVFQTAWPLVVRALVAGIFAAVATYSFVAGIFAWGLGLGCLAFEPKGVRFRAGRWWTALGLWLALAAVTAFFFFQGYVAGATNTTHAPILQRLAHAPLSFALYGLALLGAPFARAWERDRPFSETFSVAPWIGLASVVVFLAVVLVWLLRGRSRWGRGQWVFLLLALWGGALAGAVTLARTGIDASSPYQNRYLAFTLWFHIGTLGLLAGLTGIFWTWARRGWLLLLVAGYVTGAINGIDQGRRDDARYRSVAATAALRHAAPEPMMMEYLGPGLGPRLIPLLDQLAAHGCLHVPTVPSDLVSEAKLAPAGWFVGAIRQARVDNGRPSFTAWAIDKRSRDAVDAVVISYQAEGQPERWLGMGQRRTIVTSMAEKYRSPAPEDRVGWAYIHGKGEDQAFLAPGPNYFKAKPLPKGRVTFRVYAFDTATGSFSPLKGSSVLELP